MMHLYGVHLHQLFYINYQHKVKCMEFNGTTVVLKEYNLKMPTARRQFLRSVHLMHQLTHPNIAVVEATFEDTCPKLYR